MKNYTRRQIEEAIQRWTRYMFENKMIDEYEYQSMIQEGLNLKRFDARLRGGLKKIFIDAPKKAAQAIHDVTRPNKGAKMMLIALDKLAKKGIDLATVGVWASLNDGANYIPVVDFQARNKQHLILLVNPDNSSAQPRKMKELRNFIHDEFDMKPHEQLTDVVQSITVAKINDATEKKLDENTNMLFESKLTDYIEKNGLSKEEALKPEMIKKYTSKKGLNLTHDSKEKIKAVIEKYFAKKEAAKADDKSKDEKKDDKSKSGSGKKKQAKKPAKDSSSKKKDEQQKDEKNVDDLIEEPKDSKESEKSEEHKKSEEPKETKDEFSSDKEVDNKATFTALDNKLLDVIPKQKSIGFKFSKSKAEIEMDYAFTLH